MPLLVVAAGARRISVGQAIASAAYFVVRAAATQLLAGDDAARLPAIPHPEMQKALTPLAFSPDSRRSPH